VRNKIEPESSYDYVVNRSILSCIFVLLAFYSTLLWFSFPGGVSKEFFQLIVHQLMDPVHGMFVVEEDTMCTWFNPNSLDTEEFYLIGIPRSVFFSFFCFSYLLAMIISVAESSP
jgi:hypothetical protein